MLKPQIQKGQWYVVSGFSLLEVMVVVFLIATFAAVGVLKLGAGQGAVLESEAKQFADKLNLLIDESILSGKSHRVVINDDSTFYTYEGYVNQKWSSLDQKPYGKHEFPSSIAIEFSTFSETDELDNTIEIQSDGVITPFQFLVGNKDDSTKRLIVEDLHWLVSSDSSNASVSVVRVDSN
jgi:prepilin-type N-terminal cleavage/methylation domain-containing protein